MQTKAKRRATIPPELQPYQIGLAIRDLKNARDILRQCGAKNAADYVSGALKSAQGAKSHAERMIPATAEQ